MANQYVGKLEVFVIIQMFFSENIRYSNIFIHFINLILVGFD